MSRHSSDSIASHLLESRLGRCTADLQSVISRLRAIAERTGPGVCVRVYCHPTSSSWGLTYRAACDDKLSWFCHLHPKYSRRFNYVAVRLKGIPDDVLLGEGFERVGDPRKRDEFWFPVRTLEDADRVARFINEAHDRAMPPELTR